MREWEEEISRWLAGSRYPQAREAELVKELTRHLDECYEALISQGATEREAYRTTVAKLYAGRLSERSLRMTQLPAGSETVILAKKSSNIFRDLWQNLRYGVRMLIKNPGFTATAVLTLALGIGATTAIFSVVYATIYEPMPYPNPDQLMMVWTKFSEGRGSVSAGDYFEWKRRSKSFQYLEAWGGGTFNVATADRPEQVEASVITPDFVRMVGIRMFLGRGFLPEEGQIGKDRVVILNHRLWSQQFGADRAIIGKQIRMNGEPYTVVGVIPPGQADRHPSQLWVPLAFKPEQLNHDAHWLLVMGRLKDGVSQAQAQAEMEGIASGIG